MLRPKGTVHLSFIIGLVFIVLGIVSIDLSIFYALQVPALIGLGLTFWGAIFFLIAPTSYVDARLLASAVYPEYSTFDRITNDLKCEKSYYIPASPKSGSVSEQQKGLKDPVVFVQTAGPRGRSPPIPPIKDLSQGKFLLAKGKGALLTPPGLSLLKQIEKKMKTKLNGLSVEEICEVMPRIIPQDFPLAKGLTMNAESEIIHLSIQNSIYKSLYDPEKGSKSVQILGCPIASAIACILAQTSGKTITITETKVSPDMSTIETEYKIVSRP